MTTVGTDQRYPLIRPAYYRRLVAEILAFIRTPDPAHNRIKRTREKIYDTIGLFVVKIACLIVLGLLMALLSPAFDPENIARSRMSDRFSPLELLLVAGFILPLLEECGFRLSLRFKPSYLAISAAIVCYYILTKAVYGTANSAIDETFPIRAGAALAVGIALWPLLNIPTLRARLSRFWTENFRWIYYFSCLAFAFVHVFNYPLTAINIAMAPLITMPQLLSGLINGYTRTAFGFQYPLLFHIGNNIVAIGLSTLPFADVF